MKRQILSGCLCMLAAAALTACSARQKTQEERLADMKEFTVPAGSASICFDQSWTQKDAGLDTFMVVGSDDGSRAGYLLQVPRTGAYSMESIDEVRDLINRSYAFSNSQEMDEVSIPGLSDVDAAVYDVQIDGADGGACVAYGETDYAFYSIAYMASEITEDSKAEFQAICSTFRETVPEQKDATTVEISDTVRWFNASYAIITALNGWDYNRFAGLPANEESKTQEIGSLEEWWSVTDRASADETLEWILTKGHRADFMDDMQFLQDGGLRNIAQEDRLAYLMNNFTIQEDEAQNYVNAFAMYEQYGSGAISGWDYCRALNLLSLYYLAGYYTEQETLDKSLEVAQTAQPLYESWDDMIASYLRGYEYWSGESSAERQSLYEELKSRDDNPYQVDFKMELKKTW